ncbi:uncharacterized protein [Anabrus simplex]|uniref:uncharacterized protein n=1 Tax=Anabrus simplex TaxID=316456 RepID=UPI0034DD08E3
MKSPGAESSGSLEERMAAFKNDPQLMEVATRFVNEVLEKAKEEALRRIKEKAGPAEAADSERASTSRKRGRWHSRARGFIMRMFASLCLCNSNGAKGS